MGEDRLFENPRASIDPREWQSRKLSDAIIIAHEEYIKERLHVKCDSCHRIVPVKESSLQMTKPVMDFDEHTYKAIIRQAIRLLCNDCEKRFSITGIDDD